MPTVDTMLAVAKLIDYLSQREGKTEKEMIIILLVEALTARGMMGEKK
jgi:hypothetical protein